MTDNEAQVVKEARDKLQRILERTDSNVWFCGPEALAKFNELFDQTVGNAIKNVDTTEWTDGTKQQYIRRHVEIIARVVRKLADAGGRVCISADDLEDATDLIIMRARKACETSAEIKIFGHPCSGYKKKDKDQQQQS